METNLCEVTYITTRLEVYLVRIIRSKDKTDSEDSCGSRPTSQHTGHTAKVKLRKLCTIENEATIGKLGSRTYWFVRREDCRPPGKHGNP